MKQALIQWQERIDFAHKLLTLLNSYSPPELRNACLGIGLARRPPPPLNAPVASEPSALLVADVLKELVLLSPHDFLHTLVPFLQHNHCTYHHSNIPSESGSELLRCSQACSSSAVLIRCVPFVSSVVRPLPALQREHQADGSQEQHPAPEARAQHVSAAFHGGERQGNVDLRPRRVPVSL